MSQQVDDLLHLAEEAGIPTQIMSYLINNQIIANLNDLRRITPDEVQQIRTEYDQNLQTTPDQPNHWSFLVTSRLRSLIEWINSYHRTYGGPPHIDELTSESLVTLPEERAGISEPPGTPGPYGRYSMTPVRNSSYVTSRKSYGSIATHDSQQIMKGGMLKLALLSIQSSQGWPRTGWSLKGSSDQLHPPKILIEFYKMKNMNQPIQWMEPNTKKIWNLFMMHSRMLGQIQ